MTWGLMGFVGDLIPKPNSHRCSGDDGPCIPDNHCSSCKLDSVDPFTDTKSIFPGVAAVAYRNLVGEQWYILWVSRVAHNSNTASGQQKSLHGPEWLL